MCAMDIKLNQSRAAEGAKQQTHKAQAVSYVQELKDELKKISWTSKEELLFCTKMVVGAMFVFGMGTYIADLIIKGCLELVATIVRFIFG